jgi:hypothetical protein
MPTSDRTPSCPLPISPTQTARGLLRIYARLKGELAKAGAGEDVMAQSDEARRVMEHIAGLMPFLGVNFDPIALKPIRTRPHIGPLPFGDVRAGVLAQLRAHGDWMTYVELADAILAQQRVTLTASQRKHFLQKLREGTHVLTKAGAVERETAIDDGHRDGHTQQRLRLSLSMFRPKSA